MMDKHEAIRLSKYRSIITNHDKMLAKALTLENLKKILCSFKRGVGSYGSTSPIQEFDLIRYKIDNAKRRHNHESQ